MFIPYLRLRDTGNEGVEGSLYRTLMIFSYYIILLFPKPVVKHNSFIKAVIQLEWGMNFSPTGWRWEKMLVLVEESSSTQKGWGAGLTRGWGRGGTGKDGFFFLGAKLSWVHCETAPGVLASGPLGAGKQLVAIWMQDKAANILSQVLMYEALLVINAHIYGAFFSRPGTAISTMHLLHHLIPSTTSSGATIIICILQARKLRQRVSNWT